MEPGPGLVDRGPGLVDLGLGLVKPRTQIAEGHKCENLWKRNFLVQPPAPIPRQICLFNCLFQKSHFWVLYDG